MGIRVVIALLLMLTACGNSGPGPVDFMAAGRWQECIKKALDDVSNKDDLKAQTTSYLLAGECAEAIKDRQTAIKYYEMAAITSGGASHVYARLDPLKAGASLKSPSTIMSEARAVKQYSAAVDAQLAADTDNTSQTAAMTMMSGMMSQPTYTPRSRGSSYVAPSYVPSVAGASPRAASPSSRPTYRDATYCARMSPSNNPNVMNITNSCNGKITVWMGGEFRTVNAGTTVGYTTIARQITSACFNAPGEDICER